MNADFNVFNTCFTSSASVAHEQHMVISAGAADDPRVG